MSLSTVPCPQCRRNNASHRPTCMYCGKPLPNPTAPPPRARDAIPTDLDNLIRAAMTGQTSPEEVRAALARAQVPPPAPTPARVLTLPTASAPPPDDQTPPLIDPDDMEPLLEEEPLYTDEESWDALDAPTPPMLIPVHALIPIEPESPNIDAGLRALEELVQRTRLAWLAKDRSAADQALGRILHSATELRESLQRAAAAKAPTLQAPEPSGPGVSVTLPAPPTSVSHTYSLFGDCPGRAELAPRIARALAIDGVAAHTIAISRHPRVLLRGEDQATLERLAHQYHEVTRLPAAAIPREALLDIDLPRVVVGPSGRHGFQLSSAPLWLGASHDPIRHGSAIREPDIRLAIPGAVVVAHYRAATVGRLRAGQEAWLLSRETRVGVVDLHGPGLFLRLIEDLTDFTGMPGHDVRSARRSFRGFLDRLALWFPQARVFGPRICRPTEPPLPSGDAQRFPELDIDAWPVWEEHTRLCRILMQIP